MEHSFIPAGTFGLEGQETSIVARGLTRVEPSFRERIWGLPLSRLGFPIRSADRRSLVLRRRQRIAASEAILHFGEASVQVHPADEFARLHENSRGKTEMWHVLDALPGAVVAMGFRDRTTREQFEAALAECRVEDLLRWVPAHAGDTFFIPAGIVHAIGAGLTLCEIQQNSDVTYRLYDYGRPRELHLEKGLAVSRLEPYDGKVNLPVQCAYFNAGLLLVSDNQVLTLDRAGNVCGWCWRARAS